MSRKPLSDDLLTCSNPFEWFEVHPGGEVFLCCPTWLKAPVGNLLTTPVADIWNGEPAVQLRRTMLGGPFVRCNRRRCPRLAAGSAPVRPLGAVPDAQVREAIRHRAVRLPYGPKRLNLCYDRSCNLACPSCHAGGVQTAAGSDAAARITRRIVEEAGRDAETLVLSGYGDPFASPAYRGLLQGFRREDFPRLRRIDLHTNGQLWDTAMWSSMPAIHPYVRAAEISIDAATAETYAANRRGGDFARLRRNLDFVRTLPIALKISCVVQNNNFREMPAFVELGRTYGGRIYFSQLVNWGTFSREEFRARAVHLPGHPDHAEFIGILRQVAGWPEVDLGNLLPLLSAGEKFCPDREYLP